MTKEELQLEVELLTRMVDCAIGHYMDGWFVAPDYDEEWLKLRKEAHGRDYFEDVTDEL